MRISLTDSATIQAVETDSYGASTVAASYDLDALATKIVVGRQKAADQPYNAYDVNLLLEWEDDAARQLLVNGSADVRIAFQGRTYSIGKTEILRNRRGEAEYIQLYMMESGA